MLFPWSWDRARPDVDRGRRRAADGTCAHLPYKKRTYEDYVGIRGLEEFGEKEWRKHVEDVVELLVAAFKPDDVVLGGGNAKKLKEPPPLCRLGDNANAFKGGFRMWEGPLSGKRSANSRKQAAQSAAAR